MSDLFGTPVGTEASERTQRENALSGVQALHIMGQIEQQPADLRLKTAHARLYESEADLKQTQVRDAQALQKIEADITAARAQGVNLTPDDLAKQRQQQNGSLADPIIRLLNAAQGKVSSATLAPLAVKAATIQQHEASTVSAQAEAQVRQLDAAHKRAERMGELATIGLRGPQGYSQMLMTAASEGLPIDSLPKVWGPDAQKILTNVRDSSVSVKDQLAAQRRDIHDKAQEARWRAENARDSAAVKVSGARYALINERYKILKKNGGEASPEVKALREERTKASTAKREAQQRLEFPQAPIDPTARAFFKKDGVTPMTYTAADGKTRFMWVKDPVSGQGRAMVLPGTNATAVKGAAPADTTDDEEED